ncbi:MAG: hypothetical protein WBG92_25050 [Thiohalocapsa sp.]
MCSPIGISLPITPSGPDGRTAFTEPMRDNANRGALSIMTSLGHRTQRFDDLFTRDHKRNGAIRSTIGARFAAATARIARLVVVLSLCSLTPGVASADSNATGQSGWWHGKRTVRVDVVENPGRFVFDEAPVFEEDGMPAYGNSFITEGFIYPDGFLDAEDGVDADGNPTHPEQVLGEWTCWGYFVGNGARTLTGPVVISTQMFDFYAAPGWDPSKDQSPGAKTIVTDGYERMDVGVSFKRAITGGTGTYSRASGEALQEFLGFGDPVAMNVKQRHRIRIRR